MGVVALYAMAFARWREALALLGAQTWEVEVLPGAPLTVVPGLHRGPALSLHQAYAVPQIPGRVLAALAGILDDKQGAAEKQGSDASGDLEVGDRSPAVAFFDAWYVPGTAPGDYPLAPPERGGECAQGDRVADSAGRCLDEAVSKEPAPGASARGTYLVAAVCPAGRLPEVRRRLSSALQRVRCVDAGFTSGEDEEAGAPEESQPLEQRAPTEAPAPAEQVPTEVLPEGPREWGLRQVVLVPQDGSLRAEGPQGEKGVAARPEVDVLIASLPEDVRERFKGRKRRAKLLVTVEPRGNVWRITRLGVQKAEGEEPPEESE